MLKKLTLSLVLYATTTLSFGQTFTPLIENIKASFRGISTIGNKTVWVSGSNGTVGYTNDSGQSWSWVNPIGYEKYDFRDIHVFSEKEAIIVNAGSPAVILRTVDKGKSWTKVYENNHPDIFLDDIVFLGKNGYALGDPIDGTFQLLYSENKGKSWNNISENYYFLADDGEAAFAASGSSMAMFKDILYIGTGGKYASLFAFDKKKLKIDKYDAPILSGESSTGIFAIDFWDKKNGIAVGGDYLKDRENSNVLLITTDGGFSWQKPNTTVNGYKSDVIYIDKNTIIATGTSGTDISYDAGVNWKNISPLSFNAIAKSGNSNIIYLTGSKGNIYKLTLNR